MDVNDRSHLPKSICDFPDVVQSTNRKEGDINKVIFIPIETANFITGKVHSAFVSTTSIEDLVTEELLAP